MKKVIVVGASSGIGKELAKLFVKDNWLVGITGRRKNLLEDLKGESPEWMIVKAFDNTKDDIQQNLNELITKLGGLDLAIICSGTGELNPRLSWIIEKQTLDLNVIAWTEIANFFFDYFNAQNHGHLAAITSIAAIRGESRTPAYNASKAFQANYLQALRKKAFYEKRNINITDIQPGFVKTSISKSYKRYWESPVDKAARQIFKAIRRKRKRVYITKRWWLIAQILKILPGWIYNRI